MRRLVPIALVAAFAACARPPKPLPTPVASAPQFPEFIVPLVPPDLAASPAAGNQDRGWRFLQAGDFKSAERELEAALKVDPTFYPAEAAYGWVELARKDAKAALPHFDRAVERQHRDVSALVGRGQSLLSLNRESEALTAFEAVLAVDASVVPDLGRRVEVLKFRRQQEDLTRAREAARTGRADEAVSLYSRAITSSPDSAFLYRELANVEHQQGADDRALEHFRKAIALDPPDAKSLAQIGAILDARGDFEGAAQAYTQALAAEPNDAVEAKLENARARAEVARLPEEYRSIDGAPQLTRADLAAVVGVRLAPLLQARRRDAVLITDIRNHWAANWIIAVARAEVMEPFANHAFQPRTLVRRIDLAQVVSRLLGRVAEASPGSSSAWQSARLKFADISAGHLAYPAASAAVASGVMTVGAGDTFQPSRPVSGREAIEAIDRIDAMVRGIGGRGKGGR